MSSFTITNNLHHLKPPLSLLKSQLPSSFPKFKFISFQALPTSSSIISSSSSNSEKQVSVTVPPKLEEMINLFQAAQDPRAKYQQLLFYANNLSPLQPQYKTNDNKVEGCVSQVWVRAYLHSNNNLVYFEAESDSIMTKGLAALLVQALSGLPISQILSISPDFITQLGLQQNLTPSRNNGFFNMFKLMQRKALLLGLEAEKQQEQKQQEENESGNNTLHGFASSSNLDDVDILTHYGSDSSSDFDDVDILTHHGSGLGSRGERIREILERELKPVELDIEDISHQHAGHMGGVDGDETHFNLKIVSNEFEGKSLVKRHRMIYGLLQDELQNGLHALSIIAKTPSEAEQDS